MKKIVMVSLGTIISVMSAHAYIATDEFVQSALDTDLSFDEAINNKQPKLTLAVQSGDGAVTGVTASDGTVTVTKTKIENADIASDAITTAVIKDSTIGATQIAAGTIVDADIASNAAIELTKVDFPNATTTINESGTEILTRVCEGAICRYGWVAISGRGGSPTNGNYEDIEDEGE